jgi:1,4-dihydroxy-2-naphthoate octaprenyltransferase
VFPATLKAWIGVQKLPRHAVDVFSYLLGSVLAWYHTGVFHWGIFAVGLMAAFFIANGIYLTNEAQDYESDKRNTERIGGGAEWG